MSEHKLKDWYHIHEEEMKSKSFLERGYPHYSRSHDTFYIWNGYSWVSDEEASREANNMIDYGNRTYSIRTAQAAVEKNYSSHEIDERIAISKQIHADQIDRLLREKERIESLPKEPNATEDGTNSILFKIKFLRSSIYYIYVATFIEETNIWYVSGPNQRNNGGYTWDALINWITRNPEWEIWHVSEYKLLASS